MVSHPTDSVLAFSGGITAMLGARPRSDSNHPAVFVVSGHRAIIYDTGSYDFLDEKWADLLRTGKGTGQFKILLCCSSRSQGGRPVHNAQIRGSSHRPDAVS